jgi:hypothetical protein
MARATLLEWLECTHLPKGKELAISYLFSLNGKQMLRLREHEYGRIANRHNVLQFSFRWDDTEQGHRFWRTEDRINNFYLSDY